MDRRPILALLGLAALVCTGATREADAAAPTYQEALETWWQSAARLWLDEYAYRVDHTPFTDGLCKATLDSGVIIPVYSGQAPVSKRMVGLAFIGEGTLEVEVPERADRWRFANHMVTRMGGDPARWSALAHGEEPYRTRITRALILSADPRVPETLLNLEPIGGGVKMIPGENGVDEVYVVTEGKGKFKAQVVATNMLPQRRNQLQKAGLDPRPILRQDRLLHEELGLPGEDLRAIADFRTDDSFGIASGAGARGGPQDYDKWLTCFRDGLDQSGTGFESIAFTHGTDGEGDRHFERLAGKPIAPPPLAPTPVEGVEGADEAPPEEAPPDPIWPPFGMAPVHADTTVTVKPIGMGNTLRVETDQTLTVRAQGGKVQHLMLGMPADGAINGTFELTDIELVGGPRLAVVGLTEDMASARIASATKAKETDTSDGSNVETDTTSSAATDAGLSISSVDSSQSQPSTFTEVFADENKTSDGDLVSEAHERYEILAVLPEPVPEGQEVKVHLKWTARWQFANWSAAQGSDGTNLSQPLGPTTGLQPLIPELIPYPGGTPWTYTTRVGVPGLSLRSLNVALSGDTTKEYVDEALWPWIEASGTDARSPGVAIGRWQDLVDPAAQGLPEVRVHLFSSTAWALDMFPPEARRVVVFLQRFLHAYPQSEVDIFQGASTFSAGGRSLANAGLSGLAHGLVAIKTVKTNEVTDRSTIEEQGKYIAQRMIARQVATQYWGQSIRPATARENWIITGLSDAYAAFYVRGAFGNEEYEELMGTVRKLIEQPVERAGTSGQKNRLHRYLSLTGATEMSDVSDKLLGDLAFYLLGDMIRLRIGDQAYFAALDRLGQQMRGRRIYTAQLKEAFEQASGQDLDEFFDWWVHGGFIPSLTVEVREEAVEDGTTVHGCIVTDIPFGRFDVPIEVKDQDGERSVSALVDVIDGRGSFEVTARSGKIAVTADPLGLIVAYDRKVKSLSGPTTCEEEGSGAQD